MFDFPLIECVPNVSEGRNLAKIEHFASVIRSVSGVHLLHVDSNSDAHRTVFTFVGAPSSVAEAAFRLAESVTEAIDMREHEGAHPRLGALDVCPFVPLSGVTLEECAELARGVGERIGSSLSVPVYLYESSARLPHRTALPDVRRGEYEGLEERLRHPDWEPDYGPAIFGGSGAYIVGARRLLIALNIGLDSNDLLIARTIASRIRSRPGHPTSAAGLDRSVRPFEALPACRAIGWMMPSYGCVQVSTNLRDIRVTGVGEVFRAVEFWSSKQSIGIRGSELIGLMPERALREAWCLLIGKSDREPEGSTGKPPWTFPWVAEIEAALGLSVFTPFDPAERVLEWRIAKAYGAPSGVLPVIDVDV